jgi:hypothetical protein
MFVYKIDGSYEHFTETQTTEVNNSKVANSIKNIMNNISTTVIQENIASFSNTISALNKLSITNTKTTGDIDISNVNQKNKVDVTVVEKQIDENINKINNDISTQITSNIDGAIKTLSERNKTSFVNKANDEIKNNLKTDDSNILTDVVSEIVKSGMGIENPKKNTNINKTIEKSFKLNNSINIEDNMNVTNVMKSTVNQENIGKCSNTVAGINNISLDDLQFDKITIDDIKQKNLITGTIKCIFSQQNVSQVTNRVATNINQIINSVNSKSTTKTNLGNAVYEVINELGKTNINDTKIEDAPTPTLNSIKESVKQEELNKELIKEIELNKAKEQTINDNVNLGKQLKESTIFPGSTVSTTPMNTPKLTEEISTMTKIFVMFAVILIICLISVFIYFKTKQ